VHGAGHHFLAAAAFAGDEHRDRRARHAQDLVVHMAHRRRTAPELAEVAFLLEPGLQVVGFGFQRRRLGHPREDARELLHVQRLDEVVGRTQAQRLDGGFQARVAGDQHHLGVGQALGVLDQRHAVAVGQHEVEQHDIGLLQRHLAARVPQRAGGGHRETLGGNEGGHHFGRIRFVVNDQCVRHGSSFCR